MVKTTPYSPEHLALVEARGELLPLIGQTRKSLQNTADLTADAIQHLTGDKKPERRNNSLVYAMGRIAIPGDSISEVGLIGLAEYRPGSRLTRIKKRPVASFKIETRVFTDRPNEENPHPRVYRSTLRNDGFATSELIGYPDADFTLKEDFGLTERRGLDAYPGGPDGLLGDYADVHYKRLASSLIIAETVRIAALAQDIDLAAPFDPTAHELMAEWQKRGNVPALSEQAQRLLDATRS